MRKERIGARNEGFRVTMERLQNIGKDVLVRSRARPCCNKGGRFQ
jgi:hypothetical protein